MAEEAPVVAVPLAVAVVAEEVVAVGCVLSAVFVEEMVSAESRRSHRSLERTPV